MTRQSRPIGPREIAEMLNVSRQRVIQLRAHDDFPEPWETLGTGYIWRDTDIEEWATKTGRTFTPFTGGKSPQ